MKNLLGGKGANLAEMANLALPVPPGFTITTEVCTYFYQNKETYPKDLKQQVDKALDFVGKVMGKKFGDLNDPLLLSVRSGARASMPGMMDTVLNLGLNDQTVEALARIWGDRRFAFDSYRRFINMYSNVVLDIGTIISRKFSTPTRETTATSSTPISTPKTGKRSSSCTRSGWSASTRSHSRRIRTSNCGARSARCSDHG